LAISAIVMLPPFGCAYTHPSLSQDANSLPRRTNGHARITPRCTMDVRQEPAGSAELIQTARVLNHPFNPFKRRRSADMPAHYFEQHFDAALIVEPLQNPEGVRQRSCRQTHLLSRQQIGFAAQAA
jgi:hypothetical protein